MHAHSPHDGAKLLEVDLAVLVLVGVQHGPVHDLDKLLVLQIFPDHHLQHLVQLLVGYKAIAVNIVDSEGKPETKVSRKVIDVAKCFSF